jgi:hypothetical protein
MTFRSARWSGRTFSRPVPARMASTSPAAAASAFRRTLLNAQPRRIRRRLACDPTVDDQLDERVAAQAIRAVQAARRFADRIEALDAGATVLGSDAHAAHRIVRRRRDLHRRGRDVQHLELKQGLIDARQPSHDRLAREVRDVEQHGAAGRSPPFHDLGVAGERDAIACGQLHAFRVVARHEAFAHRVAEDPALAARGFGHERPRRVLRLDQPRRVELHELGVADARARFEGEAEGVAVVLVAT